MDFLPDPKSTSLLLAFLSLNENQDLPTLIAETSLADWEEVIRHSQKMGVSPILYHRMLQKAAGFPIPGAIQVRLRDSYLTSLARNLQLFQELAQILRLLVEAGIPVIPLKGVFLAEKVYADVGLRPMVDLDLLLPRLDLDQALKVLQCLGYQAGYPFQVERECQVLHHLPQLRKPGAATVELHWNLAPLNTPFKIPIEQVWQAARPGTLAGAGVLEMAPEDLLLHICLHLAYLDYFSSGLRPICDIAWSIEHFQSTLDWQRLRQQANSWAARHSLLLSLRLAQRLLGVSLPAGFLESLQPASYDPNLESWAIAQVFEPAEMGGKLAEVWAPQPWLQRGWRFLHNLFPPSWEMRSAYPGLAHGLLWPLAYLQHLGVVIQRNWHAVWHLARGEPQVQREAEQRSRLNQLVNWLGQG